MAPSSWASDNCNSPGVGAAVHAAGARRRPHLQPEQRAHQRQRARQDLGHQPERRRPDREGQGVVLRHLPLLGREQDDRQQLLRRRSRRRSSTPRTSRARASTTGTSAASPGASRRRSPARTSSPTTTTIRTRCAATGASRRTFRPTRRRSRRRRPASCRSRSGPARTPTSCCSTPGLGFYDQEYQENYQPEVFAGAQPLVTLARSVHQRQRGGVEQPGRSLLEALHRAVRALVRHRFALAAGGRRHQPGQMAAGAAITPATSSRSPITACCRTATSIRSASRSASRPTGATRSRTTAASSCRTGGRSTAPPSTPASAGTGS